MILSCKLSSEIRAIIDQNVLDESGEIMQLINKAGNDLDLGENPSDDDAYNKDYDKNMSQGFK